MQCSNSQIWNAWRPNRDANVPNQLQESFSLPAFEVQEEVGFVSEFPPFSFSTLKPSHTPM